MQEVTPSEILGELRNDGRSRHHRAEAEKAIARLGVKLAGIKADLEEATDGHGLTRMLEEGGA